MFSMSPERFHQVKAAGAIKVAWQLFTVQKLCSKNAPVLHRGGTIGRGDVCPATLQQRAIVLLLFGWMWVDV